jgi:hypothetical protein
MNVATGMLPKMNILKYPGSYPENHTSQYVCVFITRTYYKVVRVGAGG